MLDGGDGDDFLNGGIGNDIYILDVGNATLSELAGEGTDEIRTVKTFDLAAYTTIEHLTLTDVATSMDPATSSTMSSPAIPATTTCSAIKATTR